MQRTLKSICLLKTHQVNAILAKLINSVHVRIMNLVGRRGNKATRT